jgi:hypoxanthine phosphoribosyltransferase
MEVHPFVEEVLVSQDQLAKRVAELGQQISKDYAGAQQLVVVCVLKGAFVFCADLIRAISGVPVRSEFLKVSRYSPFQLHFLSLL